ncbi:MAG: NAD(FAD)-utilizing dehydrogenase [Bacillota bacterium]|nr:NAD(FAD)-utilizing dehydrogenase [Bacillota bacterium]
MDTAYYRISEIKLSPDDEKSRIPEKICRKLGLEESDIIEWKIVKESIDARKKPDIRLVYTVDFLCDKKDILKRKGAKISLAPDETYEMPVCSSKPEKRPVIIGSGPCGMFAAYVLAHGGAAPLVIEQGSSMEKRVKDVEKFWNEGVLDTCSNVQFGEGGAGTFSDGKLTTGIKDIRIKKILEVFVKAGADEQILYKNRPHIGTDVLRKVVVNIRKEIESLGGAYMFDTRMTEILTEGGAVCGIAVEDTKTKDPGVIPADFVILAPGHSSRDTIRMLAEKDIKLEQKPFSMGVRVQHPQKMIDRAQYGDEKLAEKLGPADYKLNCRCSGGRGVYTFCMCPGGEIVRASSEEGGVVVNGMSYSGRDGEYANSALLADIKKSDLGSDDPFAGMELQEKYERLAFINGGSSYKAPETTWSHFREDDKAAGPVTGSLPDFVSDAIREAMPHLGKKLKGFDDPETLMVAVESRSSSPVRILRDNESRQSIPGLFPSGEGAGYAGGIVSSAVDGMKTAEKVIQAISSRK